MSFQKLAETCWHNDVGKEHAETVDTSVLEQYREGGGCLENLLCSVRRTCYWCWFHCELATKGSLSTGPSINVYAGIHLFSQVVSHVSLDTHRHSRCHLHTGRCGCANHSSLWAGNFSGPESVRHCWKGWSLASLCLRQHSQEDCRFLPQTSICLASNGEGQGKSVFSNALRALRLGLLLRCSVQLWCYLVCCLLPSRREVCILQCHRANCFQRGGPILGWNFAWPKARTLRGFSRTCTSVALRAKMVVADLPMLKSRYCSSLTIRMHGWKGTLLLCSPHMVHTTQRNNLKTHTFIVVSVIDPQVYANSNDPDNVSRLTCWSCRRHRAIVR